MSDVGRFLKFAGLFLLAGIPSLVIVVVLGAVGISFSIAGIVLMVAGHAAAANALPWWVSMDADPRLAMIIGPFMSVIGMTCLVLLAGYLRLATRFLNRVLPPRAELAASRS